jgi:uncharacterized protein (TIGR02588 family)
VTVAARRQRTTAEWITFAASSLVLAAVVGLLLLQTARADDPASPTVRVDAGAIEPDGDRFRVPAEVRNTGDRAATNIEVSAELAASGDVETAEQTIDFLGGDETVTLVFLFAEDPADGELTIAVTSFTDP